MALTYIASASVGSGGASFMEFTSIPQTYTDLLILSSVRENDNAWVFYLEFNGSSANRSQRRLVGNGSSASSNSSSTVIFTEASYTVTASTFGSNSIYIPNYTSSNNKSISIDGVSEANQTLAYMALNASLWSNSAAITSIKLVAGGGLLQQYSTATLYGIS